VSAASTVKENVPVVAARPFSLLRELRKWLTVYSAFFSDALVYRANAVIWLLTDIVPSIIMPLTWLASYNGRGTIGGFTPSRMVIYYMVILFLSCAVESHIMWDMATEIKNGKFNNCLTRPYSYMAYCFASNMSWRFMRTLIFVPLFCCVLLMFHHWVHWNSRLYDFGWRFWLAVILGHLLSFSITYCLGLISLHVIEARSIYNFYYLPLMIFNGSLAPLSFFPPAIAKIALLLPFNYTLGFAAQVFIGQAQGAVYWQYLTIQIVWLFIALVAARLLWRGGLVRYTAYGI
jgi:ABC-2 type transport system permease protein